uniref:Uncharacterized protein n=1 Tax=Geoglobus ahangari TaxID=113653 RepID=A0A7J3TIZ5_9EURY
MNYIRYLVENYYDIQKLRVETFNRIVCFVRENRDKIIEMIKDFSHKRNEIQINSASHSSFAHHGSGASQYKDGDQPVYASHLFRESQRSNASHKGEASPFSDASHLGFESHLSNASHLGVAHHRTHAGLLSPAFQRENASQGINASPFVDASHMSFELQNGGASHSLFELQSGGASHKSSAHRWSRASHPVYAPPCGFASHPWSEHQDELATLLLNGKYSEFVKKYVITKRIELKEIENLVWFHNKLYETEKELYRILDSWSKEHPLRVNFLNKVRGIGPVLASGIIAWLSEPILKAEHVSNLWSYCGLAPGSERRRGEKLNYNPKLKTFCWKIGQSFIKFRCFGRKLYEKFKEDAKNKHPDWSKLHIHNYARRKVVKLFLASVWEVWRRKNNLPVTEPYPIEVLGHAKIIPQMWMER